MSATVITDLENKLEVIEEDFNIHRNKFIVIMESAFRNSDKAIKKYSIDDDKNPRAALRRILNDKFEGRTMRYGRLKGAKYSLSQKQRDEYIEAREQLNALPDLVQVISQIQKDYEVVQKTLQQYEEKAEQGEATGQQHLYKKVKALKRDRIPRHKQEETRTQTPGQKKSRGRGGQS